MPYNNAFCVSVSRDRGETWKRFPICESLTGYCEALACGPSGTQVIYAGGQVEGQGVIYRSDDLGISWQPTAAPPTNVVSLATHPADPSIVYAAAGRLYRSTDSGESWSECPAGQRLRSVRVNQYQPALVAAGGDSGVVLSLDAGATWTTLTAGLEDRRVSYVAFADSGRWLVCATYGHSCFAWPLATGIAERPQLAPRGARPGTTAGPTLVCGRLRMADGPGADRNPGWLLDATGRQMLALKPGNNDVSRLAPGVYFIRLAADGYTRSQKLVVQR